MLATPDGIMKLVRLAQLKNTYSSMLVRLEGLCTRQAAAIVERVASYAGDAGWDRYAHQAAAILQTQMFRCW